jgi:hypothetical protein
VTVGTAEKKPGGNEAAEMLWTGRDGKTPEGQKTPRVSPEETSGGIQAEQNGEVVRNDEAGRSQLRQGCEYKAAWVRER